MDKLIMERKLLEFHIERTGQCLRNSLMRIHRRLVTERKQGKKEQQVCCPNFLLFLLVCLLLFAVLSGHHMVLVLFCYSELGRRFMRLSSLLSFRFRAVV